MSTTASDTAAHIAETGTVDFKLEVVILSVADVDRAKQFYTSLGWREDADFPIRDDFRVVQLTPPGSPTSVIFGTGVSAAAPGSSTNLFAVRDIEAAHAALSAGGAEPSDVFHGPSGFDIAAGVDARESGPDPQRNSYKSWITFNDPDGNRWLVQELTTRLPGR
jgi:catechol 2,3-dioxygenase-like lactoylglutathione lyase family enzyme